MKYALLITSIHDSFFPKANLPNFWSLSCHSLTPRQRLRPSTARARRRRRATWRRSKRPVSSAARGSTVWRGRVILSLRILNWNMVGIIWRSFHRKQGQTWRKEIWENIPTPCLLAERLKSFFPKKLFMWRRLANRAQVLLGRLAGPKMAVQQLHLNLRKQELGLNVLLAHRRLIARGDCSFDFSKNYHIKVPSCFVDCLGVLEQERFWA